MRFSYFSLFVPLFLAFSTFLFAQNSAQEFSDGALVEGGKNIPVKIFSTTDYEKFYSFPGKEQNDNVLVILNDHLKSYQGTGIFEMYRSAGYQLLTKEFVPLGESDFLGSEDLKYLYLPKGPENIITPEKQVELKTPFLIWDPSTGLKLGPLNIHYYSLMFVLAFGLGYVLMARIFKIDGVNAKYLDPLFTWTLLGTILGARLGHVIFYQPELFQQDFWSVFLPIQTKPELRFTGFAGLASHGAAIALIATTLYYALKVIKKHPFWVYDRIGIVVALGGAFVRIGNFFNSEIIGKPVAADSPLAVLFPQMSSEYGVTVPRYPTQLLEAGGYFLLFILLWMLYRYTKVKYQQGFLFGVFFIILWSIRFFVEYLKEPQGDEFIQIAGLNTGQILSIPFILIGIGVLIYSKKNTITPEENGKPD